jgi:hypothetical protein
MFFFTLGIEEAGEHKEKSSRSHSATPPTSIPGSKNAEIQK